MNTPQASSASYYAAAYQRLSPLLPGGGLGWLTQARRAAVARFARQGFPTQRDEDWKYTSLAAIAAARYDLWPAACTDPLAGLVSQRALASAHLLVFVNGRLHPGLSRPGDLPPGVRLNSLAYCLEEQPASVDPSLLLGATAAALADLNLAFMADGAYLHLAADCHLAAPIQLLFIASQANLAIQQRNVLWAAAGSSACIIEQHVALGEGSYLTNALSNVVLEAGASVEHYLLQQESPAASHIATIDVRQQAKSSYSSASFAFGAGLARTGITVALQGEAARCSLDGLYLTAGRQHVDHHTCIDHRQAGGTSRQLYKGVLSGASRAVFNGRVVVHPDAQRSDAEQSNRNLLLSDKAEIDTKPQLEIWADDVKCSHAATVAQLDEEQVFYLRSRGIEQAKARTMLSRAFAREMVDRVACSPLQEALDEALREKLQVMSC